MRGFLDRLGFPGSSWRRPVLWTLLSVFVTLADALPPYTGDNFGSRAFHGGALLVFGGYTANSWRKHRQLPIALLGRAEWPQKDKE